MNKVGPMNAMSRGSWRMARRAIDTVSWTNPVWRGRISVRAAVLAVVMSNSLRRGSGIEVRAGDIEEDIVEGRCTKVEPAP